MLAVADVWRRVPRREKSRPTPALHLRRPRLHPRRKQKARRRLDARCAADQVSALFLKLNDESERLSPQGSDALHPAAFAKVMQESEGLLDSDAFLDFLRSNRLMPHEDHGVRVAPS